MWINERDMLDKFWERGFFKSKKKETTSYMDLKDERNNILRFLFPVNLPGLGDRFVMASNIISTIHYYRNKNNTFVVDIFTKATDSVPPEQYLNLVHFNDVMDFFHFERPQEKIISYVIDDELPPHPTFIPTKPRSLRKNVTGQSLLYHEYNMRYHEYKKRNYLLYNYAQYWPIKFDKTVKKNFITFTFYVDEFADIEKWIKLESEPKKDFSDLHKHITPKEEKKFNQLKNFLSHELHHSSNYPVKFVRLEDVNFKRNVELLSKSLFLISSEGMWTHLSRAMKVDTIAYSRNKTFIEEFNKQGHFCSGSFEECLIKLKEKCIDLKI